MTLFRGKKIFLNLAEDQLALLISRRELRAIFLDGGHILDVGTRPGQIDPADSLLFLSVNHLLDLRWTFGNPVDLPGPEKRHIIGNCSLALVGPALFYEEFLKQAEHIDAPAVKEAVENVTRRTLTDYLDTACSGGPGLQACLQTTLMGLQPETLSEELAGFGLGCTQLALYTAQPPVESCAETATDEETAGHSRQLTHN